MYTYIDICAYMKHIYILYIWPAAINHNFTKCFRTNTFVLVFVATDLDVQHGFDSACLIRKPNCLICNSLHVRVIMFADFALRVSFS